MENLILIITCEDCGQVKHYSAAKENEIESLIKKFRERHKKCNQKLFSYITIHKIPFQPAHKYSIAKQV